MRRNTWRSLINFLNDNGIKRTTSRRTILDNVPHRGLNTLDTYINYLIKAGFLVKINRGMYYLVEEIPVDISVMEVRDIAYGGIPDEVYIGVDPAMTFDNHFETPIGSFESPAPTAFSYQIPNRLLKEEKEKKIMKVRKKKKKPFIGEKEFQV